MKLAPSEPLIRLLYLSGLSRNGRTPTQTKPLLFHLKWKSILKRQILVLGFWCISNCCNACNSLLFLCSPGASLYLDICIFSAAPSRWTCADLFLPLFSRNEYAAYSIIVCGSLLSFPFQRPWLNASYPRRLRRCLFQSQSEWHKRRSHTRTRCDCQQIILIPPIPWHPDNPMLWYPVSPASQQMCEDNCQGSRLPDSLMAKTFHHIFHFIFHIAFLIKPFFVASPYGLMEAILLALRRENYRYSDRKGSGGNCKCLFNPCVFNHVSKNTTSLAKQKN